VALITVERETPEKEELGGLKDLNRKILAC
jgi:hypothetical protein